MHSETLKFEIHSKFIFVNSEWKLRNSKILWSPFTFYEPRHEYIPLIIFSYISRAVANVSKITFRRKYKSFPSDSMCLLPLCYGLQPAPLKTPTLSTSGCRVLLSQHVINFNIHNNTWTSTEKRINFCLSYSLELTAFQFSEN